MNKEEYWQAVKVKFDELVVNYQERYQESIEPEYLADIRLSEIQKLWEFSDYLIGYSGYEPIYDGGPLRFAFEDLVAGKRDYNNPEHLRLDAYLQFEKWLRREPTYWQKVKANIPQQSKRNDLSDLLTKFTDLKASPDPHQRGYLLQDLLNLTFTRFKIPLLKSFTRNKSAEQIDGAFKLEGWHYLVECRWRKKLANIRELDGLKGQVDRSGKQTMGFFLSINGWSDNVPSLLKQNPDKSIVLMNGDDLDYVLRGQVDLKALLLVKIAKLNFEGESFYSVLKHLNGKTL